MPVQKETPIEFVPALRRAFPFGAGGYAGGYCNRHAKDTVDDRRFQLAGLVLYLQWDTSDLATRILTNTWGLLVVGIRSDTREEPIESAGADERCSRHISMSAAS